MKKIFAVLLACLMLFAAFAGCSKSIDAPEPSTTQPTTEKVEEKVNTANPFTGEEDYNEKAVGKRPVAIVIENHPQARPQWSIGSSDIIVEGEVEGGISRMLWLYADYTSVPEKVGPARSARPSFVEFASFFDAYFIHWGGSASRTKQNYVGGYGMIKKLGMNNIDGMGGSKIFGRDKSRRVATEHTGIVKGKLIPEIIKDRKYRTRADEAKLTKFSFNDEVIAAGESAAKEVGVKFSSRTDTRRLSFNEKDKLYHTSDWKTDVKFTNIIVLCPESKYITLPYKGSSTTYLNYKWTSGKGYYISNGTACEINWDASKGVIVLTDASGKELSINKGKSYIAFASSNNGGSVTLA